MKIGINALFIRPGWHGGTEVYLRNLLRVFPEVGADHEFYLFTNAENHSTFAGLSPKIRRVRVPLRAKIKPLRVLAEQTILPLHAARLGLDVIHGPGYSTPALGRCARVVTIHDMQYAHFPDIYPRGQYLFFRLFIPLSAKTSTAVITDAESTRADVQRFLSIPAQKITAIPLAPDPRFARPPAAATVEAIRARYNLPQKYILTVSSFRPQKNTLRLIEAFHRLKQERFPHKLVLVGRKLSPFSQVQQLVERLNLAGDVLVTGYLPDDDLPPIYAGADLFAFPSYFEGFGIPVLEAMACGVPVVLARAASLPEVGGEAGLYVDPYSVDDIAAGMRRVLSDSALAGALSQQGLARARTFSWERTARETLAVFERAVALHRR